MNAPHYDDISDEPLTSDDDVLTRVTGLLEQAIRRQIWLMFLDEDDRQLPLLMPSYVPRKPSSEHRENYSRMLGVICEEANADAIVVAYERPGSDTLSDADREWLTLVREACAEARIPLRGPLLVHDGGVRWIAAEDIITPVESTA